MLAAKYIRHFSVLGKLCKFYDESLATSSSKETLLAGYLDQVANDDPAANDITLALTSGGATIQANISKENAIASLAKAEAVKYLRNSYFTGGLTTVPTSNAVVDILAALQTEMGAGLDNKTLSTKASTGLVNFLDSILGSSGTWNTVADATADYKDSVYVVSTIVPD